MLFYDMVFLEFLSVFEQFYTLLCFFCLLYLAHAFCYSLILCNSIHIYICISCHFFGHVDEFLWEYAFLWAFFSMNISIIAEHVISCHQWSDVLMLWANPTFPFTVMHPFYSTFWDILCEATVIILNSLTLLCWLYLLLSKFWILVLVESNRK